LSRASSPARSRKNFLPLLIATRLANANRHAITHADAVTDIVTIT